MITPATIAGIRAAPTVSTSLPTRQMKVNSASVTTLADKKNASNVARKRWMSSLRPRR
jgi:hypothetical protein